MSAESRTPRCPYCGFIVFNSRYPRCEKCGEQLPGNRVLSKEELVAVLDQERRERERKQRGASPGSATDFDAGAVGDIADGLWDAFDGLSDLDL